MATKQVKLTLGHSLHTFESSKKGPAYRYEVDGVPGDEQAWIFNVGVGEPVWRITRTSDGVREERKGDYSSADQALAALQREIDRES